MVRRPAFLTGGALTAATLSLPRVARAAPATVKIGYLDSFSGPLADIGQHHHTAVSIAVDEANRANSNVKFELVAADDTSRPAIGTTEARRLIGQENVDVLMLGTSSAVTLAVGPLAAQSGVFTVAIGPQDTSITGEKAQRVLYRFAPNVEMQVRAVSQRLLAVGKKWYFIIDDFAYGKDAYARLSAVVKRAGGREVGSDLLPLGTNDFSSALTKLKDSDADVLVLCLGGFDGAKCAKQFVDFGLHKRIKLGGVSGSMEDYYWKGIPSDELAGSTFAINWAPSVSDSARKLAAKLKRLTNDAPSGRYYFAYTVTGQLIDRLHAAGTTKADALVAAFADHKFEAYKQNPGMWRACDHQCVQDNYAGAILSNKAREKADFMFEVVGEVPGVVGAGRCSDTDASAATVAMAAQKIPDRTGYEIKKV
ncbi:MAG: ABC transporter substrate-binding protein [Candidatus Eremiobacteraeota bacterium]|nr:ABC transporter substrate-binding protein [Candidatus Eremiobacteraeota bacterium]